MSKIERLSGILAVLSCLLFLLTLPPAPSGPVQFAATVETVQRDPAGPLSVQVVGLAAGASGVCLQGANPPSPDCHSQPIAGASVVAFLEQDRSCYPAGTATTAAEGRALLAVPQGKLWLLVEASGFARRSLVVELSAKPRQLTIVLQTQSALRVSVVDEQQKPIVGATVLASGNDPLPFGALTNAAGQASLTRLGSAPWQLTVAARGYERVTQSDVTADLKVTLRRLGGLIVSVIDAQQAPVPGARVLLGGALSPPHEGTTGPDGELQISGLEAGSYDLRAVHGASVSASVLGLLLKHGETQRVQLQLQPGRFVPVLVTDGEQADANPVAGADVVLVEQGIGPFPLQGRTDKDGLVTLGPILLGAASVAAYAEGFVGRPAVVVPEQLSGPLRVALRRGATVRGQVVDRNGHAIDGASIEVIGSDLDGLPLAETPWFSAVRRGHFEAMLAPTQPLVPAGELGVMPGAIPAIPLLASVGSNPALPPLLEPLSFEPLSVGSPWVSGVGGGFELFPVSPGRVRLLVRHPSYVETLSDVISLAPGGEAKVTVVMLEGASLKGRVFDERGFPVAQARIELTASKGVSRHSLFTASDGTFEFDAVPSSVVLSLARPSSPFEFVMRKNLELSNEERQEIELILPAEREAIELVVSADRFAVELATAVFISLDQEIPLKKTLFTDAQGHAQLSDAAGLALRLQVEAPGFADYSQIFQSAPKLVEIELLRGVLVQGTVTVVRGRQALTGATVTVLAHGQRLVTHTDTLGQFQLRDLTPGEVTVTVTHPDYATWEKRLPIQSTGRPDRAFELEPIDLVDGGSVQGIVLDEQGVAVVGAKVAVGVLPEFLPAGELPSGIVRTNERGEFSMSNLQPGSVTLEAKAVGKGRGRVATQVIAGDVNSDVRITLGADDTDSETGQTGGVAITLKEVEGSIVIAQVAASSEAERAGLQAGDRLLAVEGLAPSSVSDAQSRLAGNPGTDVLLELQRGDSSLKLRVNRQELRR